MKITLLSPYFPYPRRGKFYGVERYTENLAIGLKNLGNDVKIVTTYWNGGKRYDNYKGIKILRILDTGAIFKEFQILDTLNYITYGLNLLRKKNFKFYRDSDVILLNTPMLFTWFFKIIKIPVIPIFHHFL
ncbi:MAG: glycosyltransferase [Candidatus Lokiarchaeota archaeon]|nr:glycosyltransferase [Candidatus Lokiarchaeota archaeon]